MLRPTTPAEAPDLVRLADETGFFKPHEIVALTEVFDDFFKENYRDGHICKTFERDGEPLGFVYYGPPPMTIGTWELWWIVVAKHAQKRGLGGEMLRAVEADVCERGGRVLFIETSSQPMYDPTLRFYLNQGYELHAVLKEYYAVGDDKVIFRKALV